MLNYSVAELRNMSFSYCFFLKKMHRGTVPLCTFVITTRRPNRRSRGHGHQSCCHHPSSSRHYHLHRLQDHLRTASVPSESLLPPSEVSYILFSLLLCFMGSLRLKSFKILFKIIRPVARNLIINFLIILSAATRYYLITTFLLPWIYRPLFVGLPLSFTPFRVYQLSSLTSLTSLTSITPVVWSSKFRTNSRAS